MKKIILSIGVLLSLAISVYSQSSDNYKKALTLYNEAKVHEKKEDYLAAFNKAKKASELSPSFSEARNLYIRLDNSKKSLLYKKKLKQLDKVIIKEVDFNDITLEEALKILNLQIDDYNKENNTSYVSNFVVHDKAKKFDNYLIKFTLRNVPLRVVLNNMMEFVSGSYILEDYSITISPR